MRYSLKLGVFALGVGLVHGPLVPLAQAQDTTSGLVFYLPFDGDMTEKITGSAPENMPGVALGEGKFGEGINAVGNSSGLEYPIEILADNWPEGSTAAWVKLDESSPSESVLISSNFHSQLLSKGLRVENKIGASTSNLSAASISPGVWTHIASTWRKTGDLVEVNFYVDGVKKVTETRSLRRYADYPKTYVGARGNAFASSLIGFLDEVVFYDRQISDDDVAALYQGPAQGAPAPVSPVGIRDDSIVDHNAGTIGSGQLTVPTDADSHLPTTDPVSSSDESPADLIAGTNWQIVSVKRMDYTVSGTIQKREQLKYNVTLKKTGHNAAQPVRIAIRDTNPSAPWNGPNTLTKYDIDVGVGRTISKEVLIGYHRRFEEVQGRYRFIIGLNNPDGTPFKDRVITDHEKELSLDIIEPPNTVVSELQQSDPPESQTPSDSQAEGVHRRSKVAGRRGDFTIQRTSGMNHTLLTELDGGSRDNFTVLCLMGVDFAPIEDIDELRYLDDINVCNGAGTEGVTDGFTLGNPSVEGNVRLKATTRAVVGMRVCTSDDLIELPHDRTLLKAEFVYRPFTGSTLDMNSQRKVVQFDTLGFGGSCEWRPWVYCPEDDTGQRMVATGIEAHIEDFDTPGERNSIVGTRLMCEPLSQVVTGTD